MISKNMLLCYAHLENVTYFWPECGHYENEYINVVIGARNDLLDIKERVVRKSENYEHKIEKKLDNLSRHYPDYNQTVQIFREVNSGAQDKFEALMEQFEAKVNETNKELK